MYTQLKELNENIYNLSFGDWDGSSQEINELFHIIGFKNSVWEIFEPNRNYEAFVIKSK
ncbi:MAG: hypothetical protein Q8939_18960 [Bacteroidota bacterium]|nr:hypothetical protein [Bacteroidota bacterium]